MKDANGTASARPDTASPSKYDDQQPDSFYYDQALRTIARVHREFMGLPEATDVITFHHGELLVSADMAQARAAELGHSLEEELALYIVHGLLHLKGFDDASRGDAARMRKVQHRLWMACRAQLPPPS